MQLIGRQEAGLSFEEVGLLAGIFYGVSGITQTMAGFAVDRFGARPILAGGLFTIGVALSLVANFAAWATTPGVKVVTGDFNGDKRADLALTGVSAWTTVPTAFSTGNGSFSVGNAGVADELFLCGTRMQIAWIASVDRRQVGSGQRGPIAARLADRFEAAVRGATPQYAHWMTRVEL